MNVMRTKTRAAEGIYRKAGSIYKVEKSPRDDKTHARRLVQVLVQDPKTGQPRFRFESAPGFVYELRTEHLLSLEQAREFGMLYRTCCVCGKPLTKDESVAARIGPVCASKF